MGVTSNGVMVALEGKTEQCRLRQMCRYQGQCMKGKDAVMTSMEVLPLRDPWMGTQNMSRPSPIRCLYL